MGMFDWYEPTDTLGCPVCGRALAEWQGKDGPCGLFVWRQGTPQPIDQRVSDECRISAEEVARLRLPGEFVIYASCCGGEFSVEARCKTAGGIWSTTSLMTPDEVDELHYAEPRERRAARTAWLSGALGRPPS